MAATAAKPENHGKVSEPAVTAIAAVTGGALGGRVVDQGTCRRLCHNPGHAADRHDEPNRCLVPVMDGQQIDSEVGAQAIPNVGQQEVERIKLAPVTAALPRDAHRGPLNTKNAPAATSAKPTR